MKFPMYNGFTRINIEGAEVTISHGGNMGDTEQRSVKPNVDRLLGKGTYDRLRKVGVAKGSPDYWFTLTVTKDQFTSIVGYEPEYISE